MPSQGMMNFKEWGKSDSKKSSTFHSEWIEDKNDEW